MDNKGGIQVLNKKSIKTDTYDLIGSLLAKQFLDVWICKGQGLLHKPLRVATQLPHCHTPESA